MSNVQSSNIVYRPMEEVFDFMVSPHSGPAFILSLGENTNIIPEETQKGQTYDWRFKMGEVELRGKGEVMEFDRPNKVRIATTGDSNSVWTYILKKEGNGTEVTVEIEYDFPEKVYKQLVDSKIDVDEFAQKTAEQMLKNLKIILEGARR